MALLIVIHIVRLAIIVCTLSVFSFNFANKLPWLRFFGENSQAVLGYHVLILVPFSRLAFKLTRVHEWWIGSICALLTTGVLSFIIKLSNKHIPRLVGRVK